MYNEEPRLVNLQHYNFVKKDIYVGEAGKEIPFDIKRVYWITQSDEALIVGNHAHVQLSQVFVAVNGTITVELTDVNGKNHVFELHKPHVGLYVPPMYWKQLHFTDNAILLCLTSHLYDTADYINDKERFLQSKA